MLASRGLLALVTLTMLALAVDAVSAGARVRIAVPHAHALHGAVHIRAVVGHARSVAFLVDGRRLSVDRRAPFTLGRRGRLDTRRLTDGRHRLAISARLRSGRSLRATRIVRVVNRYGLAGMSNWSDSFESGNFSAGDWWWGQDDPSYAHRSVVSAAAADIPTLSGSDVARFETTPDDIAAGRNHAKVYKAFGTRLGTPDSSSPSNVSGTYSAWYYLPQTYKVPTDTWVNIFQFKEKYRTAAGNTSDPSWWIQLKDMPWAQSQASVYGTPVPQGSRPDQPVAFVNRWDNDWKTKRNFVALPLGRWFEIKAVVRQGHSIDFFIDGKLLQTVSSTEYPVGPQKGSASMEWIWGMGNYSTGPNGPLYVDQAAYSGS